MCECVSVCMCVCVRERNTEGHYAWVFIFTIHYSHAQVSIPMHCSLLREKRRTDIILLDYSPKRPGVGRADGLPFIEHSCAAVEERTVGDV